MTKAGENPRGQAGCAGLWFGFVIWDSSFVIFRNLLATDARASHGHLRMACSDLNGKSLVIIGGTTGLGLSAARAFVRAGARVVVVGRNPNNVKAAQREFGDAGLVLAADAVHPKTAVRAIGLAARRFGGFHGLYHVAGGSGRRMGDGPLHELTDNGWRSTIELNLSSLIFSNRAAVRQFLAQ